MNGSSISERRPEATTSSTTSSASTDQAQLLATERLVEVAQQLSIARDLTAIMTVVRRAGRELTGADGATFVLRDREECFYADEDAISPLWKGRRFPMSACISGWAMLNKKAAIIEDVFADDRIPQDAYRPTFVRSLAMVPIRTAAPVGAIGNYWAKRHEATDGEVKLLRALADLTSVAMENVQLYSELQRQIRDNQEAVRARDEFITVAAHEIRTPLTALQLQIQGIQRLAAPDAELDTERIGQRAARALSAARRLDALVDGLLDLERIHREQIPLELEEFDLVELVRSATTRFGASAKRAACDLRIEGSSAVLGRWDRTRIEQVLTHLLSNALKYGPGKPVTVSVQPCGSTARLEVSDGGPGIAPEVAGRVFERFGRAGPVNHYGGLGLGLYLSRQVVEAHGGTIRFDSQPGLGCTFVVELPLTPSPDGTQPPTAHP